MRTGDPARSSSLSIAHQNNLDGFVVPDPRICNTSPSFVVGVASTPVASANAATVAASNPRPRRRRVIVIVFPSRRSMIVARVVRRVNQK